MFQRFRRQLTVRQLAEIELRSHLHVLQTFIGYRQGQARDYLHFLGVVMDSQDIINRFAFHAATTNEKQMQHSSARLHCLELAEFLNSYLPECREKSLSITHLEEVMFWANAAIARNKD